MRTVPIPHLTAFRGGELSAHPNSRRSVSSFHAPPRDNNLKAAGASRLQRDRSTPSDGRVEIRRAYIQLVDVETNADLGLARRRDVGYQALRRKADMNADPFSRHLKRLETDGIVVRPARKVQFLTMKEEIDRGTFVRRNIVNDMLYSFRFVDPARAPLKCPARQEDPLGCRGRANPGGLRGMARPAAQRFPPCGSHGRDEPNGEAPAH